eukprot:Gb_30611 [translate_table: standard]
MVRLRSIVIILVFAVSLFERGVVGQLSVNFYGRKCPNVESIIRGVMVQKLKESPLITAPATLRLFFHDCFVNGCDGSVLISSRPGNRAERDAPPNLSLAGDAFDVVVRAKNALEKSCPGMVSCADILAVLARDATVLANGPSWQVLKGRRDGRVSLASNANVNLPGPDFNVTQLVISFASKGLSALDMVILSGAHTIGNSHCSAVTNRLYKFSPSNPTDPSINPSLVGSLKQACPAFGGNPNIVQPFDRLTPFNFDNLYYRNLQQRQGLLTSDQILFSDRRTRNAVVQFANNQTQYFMAFAAAMQKMGNIGIKTGNQGEIRRDCTRIN